MIGLLNKLEKYESEGKYIKVAIAGAGLMGTGMVSQLKLVKGMRPSLLADRTLSKAIDAFKKAGIRDTDIYTAKTIKEINRGLELGKYVACDDISLITKSNVDIVVDATGNIDAGARISLSAIDEGKDIVLLNVEADMTVGPYLNKMAKDKGLVYTGTAGDEPGSVKEIYDFARLTGFEVLAIGKGKNNPIDYSATPESVYEEAKSKNLKPSMLAGFIDGTNTMVEMTVMANATGFTPDVRGGHGIKSNIDELPDKFRLKEEGGILNNYKIIDYVEGIAPGVFVIVTSKLDQVHSQMEFLKMGKGPNYVLYRPYHLTSLETPVSIARAYFDRQATIAPDYGQVCDTIAIAKKDLIAGEKLEGIGGSKLYGTIEKNSVAREESRVPIGLITDKTKLKRPIKKGEILTLDMLEFDEDDIIYKLRKEQDKLFG